MMPMEPWMLLVHQALTTIGAVAAAIAAVFAQKNHSQMKKLNGSLPLKKSTKPNLRVAGNHKKKKTLSDDWYEPPDFNE